MQVRILLAMSRNLEGARLWLREVIITCDALHNFVTVGNAYVCLFIDLELTSKIRHQMPLRILLGLFVRFRCGASSRELETQK